MLNKTKYGIIINVPNFILNSNSEHCCFKEEILEVIRAYMDIDVDKCNVEIKQDFFCDVSMVHLTATKELKGLEFCIGYNEITQEFFPYQVFLDDCGNKCRFKRRA